MDVFQPRRGDIFNSNKDSAKGKMNFRDKMSREQEVEECDPSYLRVNCTDDDSSTEACLQNISAGKPGTINIYLRKI